jgi:hypothetical protein
MPASKGIVHQKTNPYSSQENEVVERLNRTLIEKARAMLQGSSLSEEYWRKAVLTANYVRNRTDSQVHGKTPLELLTGKKPRVENLQVFGPIAYVHVPQQKRKKLDAVAEKGVFLGYEANTKGYRVLSLKDKKIMVSKNVTFVEENRAELSEEIWDTESGESALPGTTSSSEPGTEKSPASEGEREVEKEKNEGSKEETLDELGGACGLSRVSPLDSPDAGATPTGEASTSDDPGRSRRARKPSTRYPESEWQRVHLAKGEDAVKEAKGGDAKTEPQTFSEAVSREDAEFWEKAMDEEMASLLENETWEVREVPHGVKPVSTK